jgi:hypothetical protein
MASNVSAKTVRDAMHRAREKSYNLCSSMYAHIANALRMISVVACKDLLAASSANKAYVMGELNALISDDTWYELSACILLPLSDDL